MKRFAPFLIFIFALTGGYVQAQWTSLGITAGISNPSIENIGAFTKYNGEYYSHTFIAGLQKSPDGTNWTSVTPNGLNHPPTKMFEWNGRLYAWGAWNQFAASVLYYSTDGGLNWTPDTAGSPPNGVNPAVPPGHARSAVVGDYICILYNNGLQNYWRHIDSTNYRLDNFLISTADATALHTQGDTLWAARGGSIHYTLDHGYNWITPPNNGLPFPAFGADIFTDGNTIYLTTSNNSAGEPGIWKSTDKGNNWTEISLGSVVGPGSFGQNRTIASIWAKGNTIYLGLGSSGQGNPVEVCYSTDGGVSWNMETAASHADGFGTDGVAELQVYDGYLYAQCYFTDVYRKGISVGLNEFDLNSIQVYPNPTAEFISFPKDLNIEECFLYDLNGRMHTLTRTSDIFGVAHLAAGQYVVYAADQQGNHYRSKLVIQK